MKEVEREVLLSFWKVHILHHAEKEPVIGQWVLRELRRHGIEVSPGTLHPMLARMEERGWLRCSAGDLMTLRKTNLTTLVVWGLLRAGWFVLVGYLALQLLVAGLSIHRVPHFPAILLLVLVGGALVTGLVFREPRSFCRAFCPANALLSVYGRYTPLQLEMRDVSACERCPSRDCVRAENRHRL